MGLPLNHYTFSRGAESNPDTFPNHFWGGLNKWEHFSQHPPGTGLWPLEFPGGLRSWAAEGPGMIGGWFCPSGSRKHVVPIVFSFRVSPKGALRGERSKLRKKGRIWGRFKDSSGYILGMSPELAINGAPVGFGPLTPRPSGASSGTRPTPVARSTWSR